VRKVWPVALTTFSEAVRQPIFYVVVFLGCALTFASPSFALFHLGEEAKMVADLGMGTILVGSLLVTLFGASAVVAEEIEKHTALTVLSKPVGRTGFILGKYLGVVSSGWVCAGVLAISLMIALRASVERADPAFAPCVVASIFLAAGAGAVAWKFLRVSPLRAAWAGACVALAALLFVLDARGPLAALGRQVPGWHWQLAPGVVMVMMELAVLAAVSTAISTKFSLVVNLSTCGAVFVVGQLVDYTSWKLGGWVRWAFFFIPNLRNFDVSEAVAAAVSTGTEGVSMWALWPQVLYGLLWSAAGVLVACVLFEGRDVT